MASAQGNYVRQALPSDPPLLGSLFTSPVFAVVWLVVRVYVGWQWVQAGLHKFEDAGWMSTGLALKGFWTSAIAVSPQGKSPVTYEWYRSFLSGLLAGGHYTWFAKVIVFGELAIGVALILGAFVGMAAFFGAFMNLNFMLAGSASTNPVLFTLAMFLVLAWKVAGYWGLDRWLLPTLLTPWDQWQRIVARAEAPQAKPAPSASPQGSQSMG